MSFYVGLDVGERPEVEIDDGFERVGRGAKFVADFPCAWLESYRKQRHRRLCL